MPLEALTACEEGAVRDRAVESIRGVAKAMPKQRWGRGRLALSGS